jgi:hypothetical protein
MATIPVLIGGGVSTEAGPSYAAAPSDAGLSVPWLIDCNNAVFNLDGWPQKAPGAAKVNSSTTGASDHVLGMYDYWKSGTSGSPTQQRIIYSGTAFYRESGGTLTSIATGWESGKMPWFEVVNDDLIVTTTSTVDVPSTWDQSSFGALGGTPPNFSVAVYHKTRTFAFGVPSAQSRLYYTVAENHEDWVGAGSGAIDIAPNDGSVITGIYSHKDELLIFKGGGRFSIWRLTGSSPTGSDAFALIPFIKGVGATNQQSIVPLRDDLVFFDDFGIHSLVATASYGDYNATFLSAPITTWFNEMTNHTRFPYIWGANFAAKGYALWTMAQAGSSTNNIVLHWDYRFDPPRFAFWPMAAVGSLAMMKDTNQLPTPWAGTYTGYVLRLNQSQRNWAGAAYTHKTLLPYLGFGDAWFDKELLGVRIGYKPKGESTFTFGWQRDGNAQQTVTLDQTGSGDTLGPSSDPFTLDTSTLGGGRYEQVFKDCSGQFKEVQFELNQATLDVDFEPHSLALEVEGTGRGAVAVPG